MSEYDDATATGSGGGAGGDPNSDTGAVDSGGGNGASDVAGADQGTAATGGQGTNADDVTLDKMLKVDEKPDGDAGVSTLDFDIDTLELPQELKDFPIGENFMGEVKNFITKPFKTREDVAAFLKWMGKTGEDSFKRSNENMVNGWIHDTKADTELMSHRAEAQQAMNLFMSPRVAQMLRDTGAGTHAGFLELMIAVSKILPEDTLASGSFSKKPLSASAQAADEYRRMAQGVYKNMN